MKIDDAVKLRDGAAQERTQMEQELKQLASDLSVLSERMDLAEKEGDLDAYHEAKADREAVEFKIRAVRRKIRTPSYNVPEIEEAWDTYAESYNAKFLKKMKAYREKVADLGKDFMELVAMQNVALTKERACIDLTGNNGFNPKMKQLEKLPLDYGKCHDAQFFSFYGVITPNAAYNATIVANGSIVGDMEGETLLQTCMDYGRFGKKES